MDALGKSALNLLLPNLMSRSLLFSILEDRSLLEIIQAEKRASWNIFREVLLIRLHTHGLTRQVKQANSFRDRRKPQILDVMVTKQENEICSVVMKKPLGRLITKRGTLRRSDGIAHQFS